ncbi:MAG: hypothetical protein OEZ58_22035 [Gammaproteobacteria bacterium]|nr:hypothetical protein [Gammaproteobacteria bacterium]MDH5731672.1 hypothetical protein [Gammaproteobacteria bacterium]
MTTDTDTSKRSFIKKAAYIAPVILTLPVSLQLASAGSVMHGNNGVGNGLDPQPYGDPPINDGPGTGPSNPGNQGGAL